MQCCPNEYTPKVKVGENCTLNIKCIKLMTRRFTKKTYGRRQFFRGRTHLGLS